MQQVLISLGSFGASEVRRHGQLYFARLAREAGADGVEVRGELLVDARRELPEIAAAMRELDGALVYSSPEGLWDAHGALDTQALQLAIDAARTLGAPRLKMSTGGFNHDSVASFRQLAQSLQGLELVIENDQTVAAGTLAAMESFFASAQAAGLPLGMTFDMGNWHWMGECPLQCAARLSSRVAYVHTKGVQRQPHKWVAVPLADSLAPWRAVLRALPRGLPWAIEYPLVGEDLLAVTREQVDMLRQLSASLGASV